MSAVTEQQSTQLIEPPRYRRRQTVAVVVILIVIIGLVISYLIQPFGSSESQQGNIFGELGWIAQIGVSFILLLASVVQLIGVSVRDLFNLQVAKTNVEEFPFHVIQDYDKLLDYLFPDPQNPLISDRKIKYLPQISTETDVAFKQKGMVLIRGRSKTGKTREACELLRRWWYSGPTILVVRSHVGLYPPFKIPENLPVRNLVIIFDDIDRYLGDNTALKRLGETLQFFQNICHDQGQLRVIATARQEKEFWEKLNFGETQHPWDKFELVQLNPLSPEKAQEIIAELSQMSEIAIEPSLTKILAEKNDGTFLNLALAFRSWLSQGIKVLTDEDIKMFEGAIKTTWRRRYEELAASLPDIKPVYATIDFMQSLNLPLRPAVINALATEMGLNKSTLSILGMLDRLRNRIDMSSKFNWYRDPKRRRNGWKIISIMGIVLFYLWTWALLHFTPGNMIVGRGSPIFFPILLFLPILILIIFFYFPIFMNILWKAKFRRINKTLEFLLIAEVPTRGNELRPYENQFEGTGGTSNWRIQNYSGEIREQKFIKYISQRLMNRYLSLSEDMLSMGEFSASRKFASLAQKLSPKHPEPLFMLGRIGVNEGDFNDAISLLRDSQNLYRHTNNVSLVQLWLAFTCFLLKDFAEAEITAKEALKEMPSLGNALWILALAQLRQGKTLDGQRNCKSAALLNQPILSWIQEELVSLEVTQENWFEDFSVRQKIPKWQKTVRRGLILLLSVAVFSSAFIFLFPDVGLRLRDATSFPRFSDALVTIFPGSSLMKVLHGESYYKIGEYEKAIADYTEAIRIDPNFAIAYFDRGNVYIELGENEKAIANYTEAIRFDPDFAYAYNNRGYIYTKLGENDKAIADYTEAIRVDPEYTNAYNNRGNAYRDSGENEKAIADYAEIIRINPRFAYAYTNRGITYYNIGEFDKAIADYTESIRIDPKYTYAYINRGNTYNYIGEYDKAIVDYTEASYLDAENAYVYNHRGIAYGNLGKKDKAIVDYTEAIRLDAGYAEAYFNRGNVYSDLGKKDKAIADYTEAIRLDAKYADAYNGRGIVYQTLGMQAKADADFQKYKELTK